MKLNLLMAVMFFTCAANAEPKAQLPLIKHCLRIAKEAVNDVGDGFKAERAFSLWSCAKALDEIRPDLIDDGELWNTVRVWSEQLKFEIPRIPEIQATIMPEIQSTIEEIQRLIESCEQRLTPRRQGGRAWGV